MNRYLRLDNGKNITTQTMGAFVFT